MQRRTSSPHVDPLSPDGDTEKIELLRFSQLNHICILTTHEFLTFKQAFSGDLYEDLIKFFFYKNLSSL